LESSNVYNLGRYQIANRQTKKYQIKQGIKDPLITQAPANEPIKVFISVL
jgi:hypothetical protein